ncbi:MAG: YbaK/EbsC family protein [Candidatus Nanopelagicales bacterium]
MPALDWTAAAGRPDLLAAPVAAALAAMGTAAGDVRVAAIDPDLADTTAFCAAYGIAEEDSANCVVVKGRRGGDERWAACMVLATTRADVNNVVRRHLDVRKISFAPMDEAVERTGMAYGGITPVGLPAEWPVLLDARVTQREAVVVGSGIRGSKLLLPPALLAGLPGAVVLDGMATPVSPPTS